MGTLTALRIVTHAVQAAPVITLIIVVALIAGMAMTWIAILGARNVVD